MNGEGDLNILLVGRQGSNTDTIILVHLDSKDQEIRMVSIPRDLFYDGRKINSYYAAYGASELVRIVEEVSGYKIHKYAIIDMYAFIDVVDILGGVDIHLDNALIDPTYTVIDNGVKSTLFYEPGDYHLSGVQALRIARSRYTTSDFSRAERQQMILKSLQEKARGLGFGDVDTIFEIMSVVLKKVETNIDLDEAIAYYFEYQDYEMGSTSVMSSGNVLFSPPYVSESECQTMIDAAISAGQVPPACASQNHAYILLPENEDWDNVKWFVRESLR